MKAVIPLLASSQHRCSVVTASLIIFAFVSTAHAAPRFTKKLSGLKPVTVVRIESADFSQSCSEDELRELYYQAPRNIRGYFETNSQGMFSYGSANVRSYQLPYATGTSCDYKRYSGDARAALGLPARPAGSVVYILPTDACTFAGLAQLGSGNGNAWIRSNNCLTFDTHIHQLGHIQGFDHAAVDANNNGIDEEIEGDVSDPMGYVQIGVKHFNAAHKLQAGWIVRNIPASSGINWLTLGSLEQTGDAITFPRDSKSNYIISYRTAGDDYSLGLDGDFHRKLSIHWVKPMGRTHLIQVLSVGQTWFGKNGDAVRFDAEDGVTASVVVSR